MKNYNKKWYNIIRKVINKIKWENTKKYRETEIKKIEPKKKNAELGYALEYMIKIGAHKWIQIKFVGKYISDRKFEDTKEIVGDPPRQFEFLRKNILPLCWLEKKKGRNKWVCFCPEQMEWQTEEIIINSKHKKEKFSKKIIELKLKECNYKCELTGLPTSEGKLAADHWIPKEKGGESDENNCVILNKILNEKKNNHDPIDWFCNSIITNFLNICDRTGLDLETVIKKIIVFLNDFQNNKNEDSNKDNEEEDKDGDDVII